MVLTVMGHLSFAIVDVLPFICITRLQISCIRLLNYPMSTSVEARRDLVSFSTDRASEPATQNEARRCLCVRSIS